MTPPKNLLGDAGKPRPRRPPLRTPRDQTLPRPMPPRPSRASAIRRDETPALAAGLRPRPRRRPNRCPSRRPQTAAPPRAVKHGPTTSTPNSGAGPWNTPGRSPELFAKHVRPRHTLSSMGTSRHGYTSNHVFLPPNPDKSSKDLPDCPTTQVGIRCTISADHLKWPSLTMCQSYHTEPQQDITQPNQPRSRSSDPGIRCITPHALVPACLLPCLREKKAGRRTDRFSNLSFHAGANEPPIHAVETRGFCREIQANSGTKHSLRLGRSINVQAASKARSPDPTKLRCRGSAAREQQPRARPIHRVDTQDDFEVSGIVVAEEPKRDGNRETGGRRGAGAHALPPPAGESARERQGRECGGRRERNGRCESTGTGCFEPRPIPACAGNTWTERTGNWTSACCLRTA